MSYNREPIPRVRGRYEYKLNGLDEYADKVAKELVAMYPKVDVMDIRAQFEGAFRFHMSREIALASVEEED